MAEPESPPDHPPGTAYPKPRAPVIRGEGQTPSEQYLAKLADRSFLKLWSYPNPFNDKKTGGKGDGKELCDLLVVCGDHVLVFSDKSCAWPATEDIALSWRRWARRSIAASVDQIRGAQRWLANFPERIFTDRKCTQKLPIAFPPPERMKVHGIVVALGAGEASREHFGGGTGSLAIRPSIKGEEHWHKGDVIPLTIGDINPNGTFMHVLDDATLDVLLNELDTITDFTSYLSKKEAFVRSGILEFAGGDEDLAAYYMKTMGDTGQHEFCREDGKPFGHQERVRIQPGVYASLLSHPQYLAKKHADKASYLWDGLIEAFTKTVLDGTALIPEGQSDAVEHTERALRYMALESRFRRRIMAAGIAEVLRESPKRDRFTRSFIPGPGDPEKETGFFFMTFSTPRADLGITYEQYRRARMNCLETYAYALLEKVPGLRRVVGIAREPLLPTGVGLSEDILLLEDVEWTERLRVRLDASKKLFNIMAEGNYTERPAGGSEFPELLMRFDASNAKNRHERRKERAKARRNTKQRRE